MEATLQQLVVETKKTINQLEYCDGCFKITECWSWHEFNFCCDCFLDVIIHLKNTE